MKITINTKNFKASDRLKENIEKKLSRLDKYFSDEIEAKVKLSSEKGIDKVESTIVAGKTIFRAEDAGKDVYDSVDRVVDKLSSQMSRFKTKLQKRYKGQKGISFAELPEAAAEPSTNIVKTKKFQLEPMNTEEAIMQMELLQHDFFVFMNMETETVNVVYKRNNESYGLLETVY